ncbi:hypothetical protein DRO64_00790 [Candidatus Bathyarchaeota archaeon]|nr:MAG: hypothetical protein DRO64_00790 [Candidatus Bathyarchaeota archaeon]
MINERIQLSTQKIFSKRAEAFRGALELLFDKYEQGTQLSEELTIIVDFFSVYRFDRAAMKTMKKRLTLTDPNLPNLRLRHA